VGSRGWRNRRRDDRARDADGAGDPDGDRVDLASSEHAWWAAREDVNTVPRGTQGSSRRRGRKTPDTATTTKERRAVFADYFTRESLYDPPSPVDDGAAADDPYRVLGVADTASWDEITAAHRRLAKEHHPDRLVTATPAQRTISERSMRDANVAYMELRRRRGR
jgi:DnaJ-domain-containing protein 1